MGNANKTVTLTVDVQAKLNDLQGQVKKMQEMLGGLKMPEGLTQSTTKSINDLFEKIKSLQSYTEGNKMKLLDERKVQSEFSAIQKDFRSLVDNLNKHGAKIKLGDNKTASALRNGIKEYEASIKEATDAINEQKRKITDLRAEQQRLKQESNLISTYEKNAKAEVEEAKKAIQDIAAAREKYKEEGKENRYWSDPQAEAYAKQKYSKLEQEAAEALAEKEKNLLNIQTAYADKNKELAASQLKVKESIVDEQKELDNLKQRFESLSSEALEKVKNTLSQMQQDGKISLGFNLEEINSVEELKTKLLELDNQDLGQVRKVLEQIGIIAREGTSQIENQSNAVNRDTEAFKELDSTLEHFKKKATYFFGIANAANLLKRAVRSALETVKDLDKVMTETAVVTDFSVGDMWAQLPEYTKRANELGVSIHDAYEAATLYYQQGLKTNEVIAVSNETLKMARIAGLGAAEATDRMTNALRGFNMEINEESAQRVNDVYSKLAAITAADTDEISTAMTKVASLAHNANMEFETTSAFLSQMIETTRESAETAGTALKTVIARFSEVKKLYSQGDLMGTDEEGEEIDVNKVSQALRSAGINLNEYLSGAKGLDDIFIELAGKWEHLDMVQQRYIATMAAGSRQQSRFIAMMSDYDRTMQLVNAANTSAGASQKQFEKTLDSLQSKLAQLKNSWDTFLMGIADDKIIKVVIDGLTKLIDALNKLFSLTDNIPVGGSLVRVMAIFGALKLGKVIIDQTIGSMGMLLGISKKQAAEEVKLAGAIATKNGAILTEEELTQKSLFGIIAYAIATERAGQATGLDALKQWLDVKAKNKNIIATSLLNTIQKMHNATLGKAIALTVAFHAALLALPVAIYVAVKAFKKMMKAIKGISAKDKFEEAKKGAENAAAAAEKATEAYNNLNSSISALDDRYETLKTLTRGTDEWRDAVREVNTEVLNLMKTYKGLQIVNENGYLEIKNINDVLDKYAEIMNKAQVASVGAKLYQNETELNVIKDDNKKLGKDFISRKDSDRYYEWMRNNELSATGSTLHDNSEDDKKDVFEDYKKEFLNSGLIEEAAKKASAGEFTGVEDAEKFFENFHYYTDLTQDDFEKLIEYGREIDNNIAEQKSLYESYKGLAISSSDLKEGTESQANNYLTDEQIDYYKGQALKEVNKKLDEIGSSEFKKEIAQESGYDTVEDYENATGLEFSDDENVLKNQLAYIESLELAKNALEIFSKDLEELPDYIKNIYSKADYTGLTDAQLEELANGFDLEKYQSGLESDRIAEADKLEQKLREIWDNDAKVREAYQNDATKFTQDMVKAVVNGEQAKADTNQKFEELGLKTKGLENFSTGIKRDLANKLKEVAETTSVEGAKIIQKDILEITDNMLPEDAEKFLELLNSSDWKSINALENIPTLLESYDIFNVDMGNLIEDMKKYDEAVRKIDLQDLIKNFDKLEQFGAKIKTGEQGRTDISEDIYRQLIQSEKVNKADFEKDLATGNYIYKGDSLDDIIAAIQELGDKIGVDLSSLDSIGTSIDELVAKGDLNAVQTRAIQAGMNDETYAENQENIESLGGITKTLESATKYEFDVDNIADYAKQVKKLNPLLSDVVTYQTALSNARMNRGMQELVDSYEDWTLLIGEDGTLIKDLDFDSQQTYKSMKKSVEDLLGLSGELPEDFFDTVGNFDALVEAIENGGESLLKFRALALEPIMIDAGIDTTGLDNELSVIKDYLINEAPTLEVGSEIKTAGFDSALNAMLANATGAQKDIENILSSIGVNVELEPIYKQVKVGSHREYGVPIEIPDYEEVLVGYRTKGKTSYTGNVSKSKGYSSKGSGGSGSSKSEKNDTWENPYDELYNLTEKINESLRTREALERRYEKLVKKTASTVGEVTKAYYDQIRQLRTEADLQYQMQAGRARQLNNVGNEYYMDSEGNRSTFNALGVTKYASYDQKTGLLQIDWSGLEALEGDPNKVEEGKAAEAYISRLEELQEQFEEVRDKLWDIEDQIEELREEAIENYLTFEDRVMDALVDSYQRQIDEYSTLSDQIKEQTDAIIKGIQDDVALSRQIRDNTKKEEDIADKEARLAYLRRDTSGANALEIKKLEEELGNARESYSDTLVDQQLTKLSDDANAAAEQRQHQIEIMQNQLDVAKENGTLWGEVWDLINTATAADGTFSQNSELTILLEETEAFQSLSKIGQMKWWDEVAEAFKRAQVGLSEAEDKYGVDANGDGKVTSSGTSAAISSTAAMSATPASSGSASGSTSSSSAISTTGSGHFAKVGTYEHPMAQMPAKEVSELQQALNDAGFTDNDGKKLAVDGKYGSRTRAAVTKLQQKLGNVKVDGYYGPETRSATLKSQFKAYKTGGLADYTGPAWLDGSKTHPELVLNAKDTENFIELKNILAHSMGSQGAGGINGGDTYYEFNIDAELGSDYDVEKLADKIKRMIYSDSSYRNVNSINFTR